MLEDKNKQTNKQSKKHALAAQKKITRSSLSLAAQKKKSLEPN